MQWQNMKNCLMLPSAPLYQGYSHQYQRRTQNRQSHQSLIDLRCDCASCFLCTCFLIVLQALSLGQSPILILEVLCTQNSFIVSYTLYADCIMGVYHCIFVAWTTIQLPQFAHQINMQIFKRGGSTSQFSLPPFCHHKKSRTVVL